MAKKKTLAPQLPEVFNGLAKSESMNEIDFLAIFIDNFQQYDEHTRKRIIDYLYSRYYPYFGYATIQTP